MRGTLGPTTLQESARLLGDYSDWNNLVVTASWVSGDFPVTYLEEAVRRVAYRYDVLRRSYVSPAEAITATDPAVEVIRLQASSESEAIVLASDMLGQFFALSSPCFARVVAVQLSNRRHLVGISIDHIVNDQLSWKYILTSISESYSRALAGVPHSTVDQPTYHRYARAQRKELRGSWGRSARDYWFERTERYGPYPPLLPRKNQPLSDGKYWRMERDIHLGRRSLATCAADARTTPFHVAAALTLMGLQVAFRPDCVGLTTNFHGRTIPSAYRTAGLFVQTVPLAIESPAERGLNAVIAELKQQSLETFEYCVPLRWMDEQWGKCGWAVQDAEAGVYLDVVSPREASRPESIGLSFEGCSSTDAPLNIAGQKQWPQTLVVTWTTTPQGCRLSVASHTSSFDEDDVDRFVKCVSQSITNL